MSLLVAGTLAEGAAQIERREKYAQGGLRYARHRPRSRAPCIVSGIRALCPGDNCSFSTPSLSVSIAPCLKSQTLRRIVCISATHLVWRGRRRYDLLESGVRDDVTPLLKGIQCMLCEL